MAQLDLFHDAARKGSEKPFETPERTNLESDSWIEYRARWLPDHRAIYEELKSATQWHSERREMYDDIVNVPRLTAGIPEDAPWLPVLVQAHQLLETRYQRTFKSVRLAWYRDGKDSVAMHGDRIGRQREQTVIAIVSLGNPRRFLMKSADGARSLKFDLGLGDLLVMGGACQRTWRHGIPKFEGAQPRMSIQFREAEVGRAGIGKSWKEAVVDRLEKQTKE